MKNTAQYLLSLMLIFMCTKNLQGQSVKTPTFNFSNGLGIVAPDSLFSINFRFRTQLRAGYNTISEDNLSASDIEGRVRRLRLRMEGFMINTKLNYYIQLSFSRGDMDWTDNDNSAVNSSPNVVRDAVIIYKPTSKLSIIFRQTNLSGTRQRVISSGELQFADRSIVNATFNLDRDFGLQFAYLNHISNFNFALKGAISSGEGRNSTISNAGLAYTGRLELLPLGQFTNRGDYFEGDVEREPKPKLSIAGGYHYNESATRTAGTLGKDLYQNRNLTSIFADFVFKFKGFSFSGEYVNRSVNAPITTNELNQERIIYAGEGKLGQISYMFKNFFEIAGRYAIITPHHDIIAEELQREEMGLGVTKYFRKHRVKLQGHIFYTNASNLYITKTTTSKWSSMIQFEIGL